MLHTRVLTLPGLLIITSLTTCEQATFAEPAHQPPVLEASCGTNGMLAARLFGSISTDIEWSTETLRCESMARPNMESCWTDVTSVEQPAAGAGRYTLTGALFCVSPLGELNGDTAVCVSDLSFTSIVNWSNE